jgi:uncharacterized membrane protein YkvA (DUF1232 family)
MRPVNSVDSSIDSYIRELRQSCSGGEGLPDIIKEVPNIFLTLQSLIKDKDISSENRLLIFAAIGYFFIPDDLFPEEELGQVGYIDDIILCLAIFQEVRSTNLGKEALRRNWKLETEDIDNVLTNIYDELKKDYREQFINVLTYVGLIPDDYDIVDLD